MKITPTPKLLVLLGGLAGLTPLTIDIYLPAFPTLTDELSASASEVQLTLTAYFVGTAFGFLLVGPLSDRRGRKGPLLAGLSAYTVVSAICVLANSISVLIALRGVQGFCASAATVMTIAIVRDITSGRGASRILSWTMLVTLLAPVVAPLIGSGLLSIGSWRWQFVALAVYGAIWTALIAVLLPETLPKDRRRDASVRDTVGVFGRLVKDREYVGYALAGGLTAAAFFAYLSGSSIVLQNVYGLSPEGFGLAFGLNSIGLMIATQVSRRLLDRTSPRNILLIGITTATCAAFALLTIVLIGGVGLVPLLVALFFVVSPNGMVLPNVSALSVTNYPDAAGSAAALLFVGQMTLGATLAPLVGIAGSDTALPLAICMASAATCALVALLTLTRPGPHQVSAGTAERAEVPVARPDVSAETSACA